LINEKEKEDTYKYPIYIQIIFILSHDTTLIFTKACTILTPVTKYLNF